MVLRVIVAMVQIELVLVNQFCRSSDFLHSLFPCRYLPPEIGCLSNLEYLDLSFNKMRNLPEEITLLNSLVSLKVANNKLLELPLGLPSLQRLENLDLSNNRLTSLGCLELESMHNILSLNLQV